MSVSSDFADKNRIGNEEGPKNAGEQEVRTFRDNSAGNKNKKEKSVYYIRSIDPSIPFIAHSLKRNTTFEEKIHVVGIPYQSSVLFWNIKDVEQNSPVFEVATPGEITCFEFDPNNVNNMVVAVIDTGLVRSMASDMKIEGGRNFVKAGKEGDPCEG